MKGVLRLIRNRTVRRSAGIDGNIPIEEVRYVVLDTELTGLDEKKDSIVSIGAVRMRGGRIDLGKTFYKLIKPETALTPESIVIHGITPSDVIKKPDIDKVLSEFSQFCGNDVVVGHFISIDVGFIDREMRRTREISMQNPVLDTYVIYEWLRCRRSYEGENGIALQMLKDPRLYEVARVFGIPFNGAHTAIIDAFITAQVFQRFIPLLIKSGIRSIGDLLTIGDPFRGGDRFKRATEMSNF